MKEAAAEVRRGRRLRLVHADQDGRPRRPHRDVSVRRHHGRCGSTRSRRPATCPARRAARRRKTSSSGLPSSPPAPRSSPSSFPEDKLDEARKEATTDEDGKKKSLEPGQLEMMKKLFDGLKVAIDVDVLGTIVKTNSPYVQGSKVTLLEMDFSQLLANDAAAVADWRARLHRGSQADAEEREGVQGQPRSRSDDRVQVIASITETQRHEDAQRSSLGRTQESSVRLVCLCGSVIDVRYFIAASLTRSVLPIASCRTLMSSTSRPSACTRNRLPTTALTSPDFRGGVPLLPARLVADLRRLLVAVLGLRARSRL